MENKRKTEKLLSCIVTLLPMLAGFILWAKLPEEMPIHYDVYGAPNGYCTKTFAVVWCPIIMLALHLLLLLSLKADKRNHGGYQLYSVVLWMCPFLSVLVSALTYAIALGVNVNANIVLCLCIGAILIVFGCLLPKLKKNALVGIKLPWTLQSEPNWDFTHRVGRVSFILGGLIIIACGFYYQSWLVVLGFGTTILPPIVASWLYYKKHGNTTYAKERKRAKKEADAAAREAGKQAANDLFGYGTSEKKKTQKSSSKSGKQTAHKPKKLN